MSDYLSLDPQTRLQAQYRDASRLDARVTLHERYSTNPLGWQAWVYAQLDLPPDAHVLEVGCGPAHLWRHAPPRAGALTLADSSHGMLTQARATLAESALRSMLLQAEARALPAPSATYDALIANHMLYHIPARAPVYAEFRRVLKPGARLYAATNGRTTMHELDDLLAPFGSRKVGSLINDSRNADGFNLEHGATELAAWFEHVTVLIYEDALVIPEAAPLVEYVRSAGYLDPAALPAFAAHVAAQIAAHGPIRITKAVGMFTASAPHSR